MAEPERRLNEYGSYRAYLRGESAGADAPFLPVLPTLDEYVDYYAGVTPDAIAAVWGPTEITYAELAREVAALAGDLVVWGVRRGDVVAVYGDSRPECYVALLAVGRVGAVFLGLSPRSTDEEIEYQLADASPSAIIVTSTSRGAMNLTSDWSRVARPCLVDDLDQVFRFGRDSVAPIRTTAAHAAVRPEDPALLTYTSGSTGFPKGALLSHRAACACAHVMEYKRRDVLGLGGRRSFVLELPISHSSWSTLSSLAALVSGGTIVFRAKWDPAETLRAIERYRLNTLMFFPPQLMDMVGHELFETADLSSLTMLLPMVSVAPHLLEALRARAPKAVAATGYGLTEAAGGSGFITGLDSPPENIASTVGRPNVPGLEHKLVNDDGTPTPQGEAGELLMRGPLIFSGYLGRPEATAEALDEDGWLHTGDLLVEGDDGDWRIVGRKSEMFKSGGENVYPTEVERVLKAHPDVDDIVVVGAPDSRWGEIGVAFVSSHQPPAAVSAALRTFAHERLSNFKVPKIYVVEPELPRLPNGKVARTVLRDQAAVAASAAVQRNH